MGKSNGLMGNTLTEKAIATMFTDRSNLSEYPNKGYFYQSGEELPEDGDLFGEETSQEVIILETECDIQETTKALSSGVVTMGYTLYFPLPKDEDGNEYVPEALKPGVRFRGSTYGVDVDNMVIGVYPTQMHGCVAYIKGTDI